MINKVILIGNVGKDPEVRQFENGSVGEISVATNESYLDKNQQWQTITEWHTVKVFGKLSEKCSRIRKGDLLYVEGKLKHRSWDKDDGTKGYATDVRAVVLRKLNKDEAQAPQGRNSFEDELEHYT